MNNLVENLNILYEDNHIIVVVKPEGILSQKDITNEIDLFSVVKEYIRVKYNKPGNVYLGLLHRLDRRVSGVMVFAKTSKAAARISNEIRNRNFHKLYYAIVVGDTLKNARLTHYLKKVKIDSINKALIYDNKETDAKEAILEYRKIKNVVFDNELFSLIEINLITGRFNQIRAQLSYIGHPIINDFKYDYRFKNYNNQLGLSCVEISFDHPTTKEKMTFRQIPDFGIWNS